MSKEKVAPLNTMKGAVKARGAILKRRKPKPTNLGRPSRWEPTVVTHHHMSVLVRVCNAKPDRHLKGNS